jgi:hypothetical protein
VQAIPGNLVASGVANSDYGDSGLSPSTTYYYVVTAVDTSDNESGASNEASATTQSGGVGPTDNPVATFYGSGAYPWSDNINWANVYNIEDYGGDGGDQNDDTAAFNAARNAAYAAGGGVVYFPAGTYYFDDDIYVRDGVVIRGETPSQTDAKQSNFNPPTNFAFPEYEESLSGSGTPNDTAFKKIYDESPNTDGNIGVVWVDINRGRIDFTPTDPAPWTSVSGENMVIFGVRTNNVASPDPGVPNAGYGQHAWQRWCYRFTYNIKAYNYANLLVANTRHNDNITDSYDQPGYIVDDGGSPLALSGSQAAFNYANHYVMEVGKGDHAWGPGTPATMPANFREGIVIRDNWCYHEMRVAIMARGMEMEIFDNIVRDKQTKNAWVSPPGTKLVGNSATLENRAIDWGGYDVVIDNNDYEVFRHKLKDGPYYSVDGEGILCQECCGGTAVRGVDIINNYGNAYIGLYKMQDIDDAYVAGNTLINQGTGMSPNLYLNANTNSADYTVTNSIMENNEIRGNISFWGDGGSGSGNHIRYNDNPDSDGEIDWSTETNVNIHNNTGFTVNPGT